MAPITMRAGYSESSNTPLRHYGHAAAWTGTPPTSSPSTSPEPPGGQVLTTLRASLGYRRRKRVRPAGYSEDVAGERPGAGPAALTRVQGGTLPDGDRRNARDTT